MLEYEGYQDHNSILQRSGKRNADFPAGGQPPVILHDGDTAERKQLHRFDRNSAE
ncbi:hypothetical protein D3C75_1376070 [compost metagenome]